MNLLYDLVANILAAFYAFIPNYAVAIILLTILVMAITTPLTLKSTRSMMVMQQLQPEMKKIQARYKDDRTKQNEELLKFYKENNINPLGGCIPLLVQMPVFFFLYAILRGLTRRISDVGFPIGWNTGQSAIGTQLTTAPPWNQNFDPAYVNHSTKLYESLSSTNVMNAFGMDLSQSLTEAWGQGILHALPYALLIVVVGFTSFYQQRQIQGRNPNNTMPAQQQTLMKIMPVILPLISINLPAGLVLYFAVSNLWRVGLQGFISRSIYGIKRGEKPEKDKALAGAGAAKGGRGGNGKAIDATSKPSSKAGSKTAATKTGQGTRNGARDKKPAAGEDKRSGGTNGNGAKKSSSAPKAPAPKAQSPKAANEKTSNAKDSGSRAGGSKATNGRDRRGGGGQDTSSKKNAGASKARAPQRSSSGSNANGGTPPTLQPRARKPKKR